MLNSYRIRLAACCAFERGSGGRQLRVSVARLAWQCVRSWAWQPFISRPCRLGPSNCMHSQMSVWQGGWSLGTRRLLVHLASEYCYRQCCFFFFFVDKVYSIIYEWSIRSRNIQRQILLLKPKPLSSFGFVARFLVNKSSFLITKCVPTQTQIGSCEGDAFGSYFVLMKLMHLILKCLSYMQVKYASYFLLVCFYRWCGV